VGYESWVERDVLMALDADPGVEAVASQPMWLHWVSETGKARRHAPDFFVRRVERGFALLTGRWRTLRHITASPSKISNIACVVLVLTHLEHSYIK
jgi:hypothetical protein